MMIIIVILMVILFVCFGGAFPSGWSGWFHCVLVGCGDTFGYDGDGDGIYMELKVAQGVTALLVEQCRNNMVIIAEQCC